MKVVMLTNSVAPDKLGGLERYVRELSRELVRQGHDVTVFAKAAGAAVAGTLVEEDGVEIARYAPPPKSDPLFAAKYPLAPAASLRQVLRPFVRGGRLKRGVVLHGHFPVPVLAPALRRLPYVYTLHAPVWREMLGERQGSYSLPGPVQGAAVRALRGAESLVLRRARRVVTLSRFMADEARLLAPRLSPSLVAGGLDTDWFSPAAGAVPLPGSPSLFCARRLVERTGVELLVRAVHLLRPEFPAVHAHIAGDGPLRESLTRLTAELGVEEHVSFLGRVSEEALRNGYRSADLAVTPTLYLEGFGLSTAEAMASGAAPVVTPAGANGELVQSLDARAIADAADAPSLAACIARMWRDQSSLLALRRAVRPHVHPAMAWPQVAERHIGIYEGLHGT